MIPILARVVILAALVTVVPGASADDASETRPRIQYHCGPFDDFAEGELIVVAYHPTDVILVLSAAPFPGSEPIGRMVDGGFLHTIPGEGPKEWRADGQCDSAELKVLYGKRFDLTGVRYPGGCAALEWSDDVEAFDHAVAAVARRFLSPGD